MSTRFITNIALAAVVVVVASQAFRSGVTSWLTFGVNLGVLAIAGVALLDPMRGAVQRPLDGESGALATSSWSRSTATQSTSTSRRRCSASGSAWRSPR